MNKKERAQGIAGLIIIATVLLWLFALATPYPLGSKEPGDWHHPPYDKERIMYIAFGWSVMIGIIAIFTADKKYPDEP